MSEPYTPRSVFIAGARNQGLKAATTAMADQLADAMAEINIVIDSPGGPIGRGELTGELFKLKPLPPLDLCQEKPVNHPHGWYRQFEKRSKRK